MPKLSTLLAASAVVAGVAASSVPANAAVISLGYQRGQDTSITTFDSSTSGSDNSTATPSTFSITINATGEPVVASPNFFTNTISVRNNSATANTLKVFVTETGVARATPFYTLNFVNSALSTLPVTESVYVSASNTAYALTTLVASSTAGINSNTLGTYATPTGLTSPYSLTFVYSIAFPAGNFIVNSNINEIGVVPEPISLSLLGTGLVGLGLIRRRSQKAA